VLRLDDFCLEIPLPALHLFMKAVIDNCQLLGADGYRHPKQFRLVTENSNSKIGLAYDYLGELVIQENGQALNQINVEQLNKGINVIRMTGKDGNVFNGKFVKE